jgi:hypothetical protein
MTPARSLIASLTASAALIASAALASPAQGGIKFKTSLTGAAEIPAGDPDGSGTAVITVNPGQSRICWTITWRDIAAPTAAHIHIGLAGTAPANNVVLPLTPIGSGCATVTRTLADAIRKSPASYYVNVHNADFPAGALRGQLR